MSQMLNRISVILLMVLAFGCAAPYRTPGSGINVSALSKLNTDLVQLKPQSSPLPARITIVRIQSEGYHSHSNKCYGHGNFCVVTEHDIEAEKDIARIAKLPMILGVEVISSHTLPNQFNSIKNLRLAAASLKTDMLLIYSVDTRFNSEGTTIGPRELMSLSFSANKKTYVSTTTSAVLFDVQTGFVYGSLETKATDQQRSTTWSSKKAIDSERLKTEAEAFQKLLREFEKLWQGVTSHYANGNN